MIITLSCGHAAEVGDRDGIVVGAWISCWALMDPAPGCQAQRRVVAVGDWIEPAIVPATAEQAASDAAATVAIERRLREVP